MTFYKRKNKLLQALKVIAGSIADIIGCAILGLIIGWIFFAM